LFQNDNVLVPGIVSGIFGKINTSSIQSQANAKHQGIGSQLPYYSRLLLVAAYLASFNPPRTDQIFFMKSAAAKRRKKGGGTALTKGRPGVTKHRKISRKLLGPQAFVLERMLAIFHAIKEDADNRGRQGIGKEVTAGAADIQMAIATLANLRLLVKMGAANAIDTLDGGSKYRVAVGWEVVRSIARSVGVEAEDYLAE
jgi:origin recognition complex subunit 5